MIPHKAGYGNRFNLGLRRLTLAALLMLLPGCAIDPVMRYAPAPQFNFDRSRLEKTLESMDERSDRVETVLANLNVNITVRGRETVLNGVYLGDRAGNFRLRISMNETVIMDIARSDGLVCLWLPRKGRFYSGTHAEALGCNDPEIALLALIGDARNLFFPRAWTDSAVERRLQFEDGRPVVEVYERPGVAKRIVRRCYVSDEASAAERIEVIQTDGRRVGSVQYRDFLPMETGSAGQSFSCPNCIALFSPDAAHSIELKICSLNLNAPIPPSKFVISAPDEQPVTSFKPDNARWRSIWE